MMRPPIAPLLPREFWKSEAEYEAARANYDQLQRERDEAGKLMLAFYLVAGGLMALGSAALMVFAMYQSGGMIGVGIGALSLTTIGLAVVQVRQRL